MTPRSRRTNDRRGLSQVWAEVCFSAIPPSVFAITASSIGVSAAIGVAFTATVVVGMIAVWILRTVRPVIGACVGVGISAAFALHSGQARDFFLPDLWYPPIVAVALLISCAARYPAVGVLFGLIGHRSRRWRADPYTRRLFTALTVAVAGAFLIRFGVQFAIFQHGSVGWLAVGRIATGMPLTAVMLVAIGWSFRRVERRPAPSTDADNGTNGPGTKADAPTRLPERIARLRQSCPG